MKTESMVLLILFIWLLPLRSLSGEKLSLMDAHPLEQGQLRPWLQETPMPDDDLDVDEEPSEVGQNIVLILGAVMLVLIVFFGVVVNWRQEGRSTTHNEH